jgi:hypothetical protein
MHLHLHLPMSSHVFLSAPSPYHPFFFPNSISTGARASAQEQATRIISLNLQKKQQWHPKKTIIIHEHLRKTETTKSKNSNKGIHKES